MKKANFGWIVLCFILSCVSTSALAISERDFADVYRNKVQPYFETGVPGTFAGTGGVTLAYRVFEASAERAALVVLPGRSEPYAKYAELAYDLRGLGFTIYLLDVRGQGWSGRMIPDGHVGYVDHFENYVMDLEKFMTEVVNSRPHAHRFLLAHSMGGAIAGMYLERNPGAFDAAVLSAPMLEINTGKYPEAIALSIVELETALGQGAKYAIGKSDWDPDWAFSVNDVTRCRVRFDRDQDVFREFPETIIGGPSNRWIMESMKADKRIVKNAARVVTPVLLFQADADLIVRPKGQDLFCSRARDCRKLVFPDSYHEILMERDSLRDRAIAELTAFFEARL